MTFRRRPRSESALEEGFTILELVIALGLLAFVMTALAGVFYSAINVAVENNLRTQAVGVATRVLESMRVSRYSELGLYDGDAGYQANCDPDDPAAETVTFAGAPPAGAKYRVQETATVPDSTIAYEVTRCVVWADIPDTVSYEDGYKKTIAIVEWVDNGGDSHRLVQRSIVYPGSLGAYAGPRRHPVEASPAVCVPSQPTGVTATQPPDPTLAQTELIVSWTDAGAPDHYSVQWDGNGSFSTLIGQLDTPSGFTRSVTVAGLSPGTTYRFRVISHCDAAETPANSSSPSLTATGSTAAASSTTCTVGVLQVNTTSNPSSGTKLYLTNQNTVGTKFALSVSVTSSCTGTFDVRATGPDSTPDNVMGTYGLSKPNNSSTFEGVANVQNDVWAPGVYKFTLMRSGVLTTNQHSFLVCARTNNPSSEPSVC